MDDACSVSAPVVGKSRWQCLHTISASCSFFAQYGQVQGEGHSRPSLFQFLK